MLSEAWCGLWLGVESPQGWGGPHCPLSGGGLRSSLCSHGGAFPGTVIMRTQRSAGLWSGV